MEMEGMVEMIILLAILLVTAPFLYNALSSGQKGTDSTIQPALQQIKQTNLPPVDTGENSVPRVPEEQQSTGESDIPPVSEQQLPPVIPAPENPPSPNPVPPAPLPEPTQTTEPNPLASGYNDYPLAQWIPANQKGWQQSNRGLNNIHYIVIHSTESSASAAINWFKDPRASVSAHYLVRRDGSVVQFVREKDIAYHAGNWAYNQQSIGIEHERANNQDYTLVEYDASATLVNYLIGKYQISPDRDHIIGHVEVPSPCSNTCPGSLPVIDRPTSCNYDPSICKYGGLHAHTDPGPYWDWNGYMQRLTNNNIA